MTEVVSADELAAADAADAAVVDTADIQPLSPLALLKGKRAALQKKLHLDMAVPRWEDVLDGKSVWVRYGPANLAFWSSQQQKREAQHTAAKKKGQPGDPQWAVKANADLLVDACRGVYFLEPGEKPTDEDLPADLPTFGDPELAEALDIQPGNAVRTIMALYGTDGDLLMAANALLGWSGEASKAADETFLAT